MFLILILFIGVVYSSHKCKWVWRQKGEGGYLQVGRGCEVFILIESQEFWLTIHIHASMYYIRF